MRPPAPPHPRVVVASLAGCLLGGLVYLLVLLDLAWSPTRTAVGLGYGSNFFDIQANALLDGHLDVPEGSLGIEGFVLGGRTFMYFPPFPALLRIPVMLVTHEFDGRLTVASMALGWLVLAVMSARLLWLVRTVLRGSTVPSRREAAAAAVLLVAMTGGTVITFVAALPWVYHEVYVWSVATVVGALYWLVRAGLEPSRRSLGWLGAFALAAVLTRTTGGFAVCGAAVLAGGWWWLSEGRRRVDGRRLLVGFLAAGLLPVAASVALNEVKFGHPYLFPLQDQVWTQVNDHRREALSANGGHITGPQFLPTTTQAYLSPTGLRPTPWFPWVSLPDAPPVERDGVVLDQTYRTASVTATTPLLSLLALAAVPVLVLLRRRRSFRLLAPPVLGAAVVPAGILMYGYVANRYTSEFVPLLVVGSAVTAWALLPRLLRGSRRRAGAVLTALALLTAYSVLVHTATGLVASAVTGRGDRLVQLLSLQHRVDRALGTTPPPVLRDVGALPDDAAPDALAAAPGCSALYLATGDRYEPWVLVESSPTVLRATVHRGVEAGQVVLATVVGSRTREVVLQTRADHQVRVVVRQGDTVTAGPWYGVYPESSTTVGIGVFADVGVAEVTTTPGGRVAVFPAQRIDERWVIRPGRTEVRNDAFARAERLGVTLDRVPGRPTTLCPRVVDAAGSR
ncbi:hypothetical protein [Phycicoccus sonneratiae]|uniref:Glycosyltransferase RgtA/B/C/D-like domain-containing protein n=1 Tax=Phycicoccus sonneratiae TaxID=2807628 RepID=A0ABS2CK82_9MICO|nr:hypothetical protein [Phycicoccus sonneraticus]MBM6399489.1 hypothetical protein [Phycicoccus sonneraticus]